MPTLTDIRYRISDFRKKLSDILRPTSGIRSGFTLIELLIACHQKLQRRKVTLGFTLIELLVVIAILGILAAAILVAINPGKRTKQARDAQRRSNVNAIANALIGYYTLIGSFPRPQGCTSSIGSDPAACGALTGGQWDTSSGLWQALVDSQGFLKALPTDPTNQFPYYYAYFARNESGAFGRCISLVSAPCNYYWIGTLLEDPVDPNKPVFRCSDFPNLTQGPGCKEVGPDTLMQSSNINPSVIATNEL